MRKIILWLFVIALVVRAIIAALQIKYGINDGLNFEVSIYGPFNPGLELYHDFYAYYVIQLEYLAKGLLPYRDFAYSYPPLFLYLLYSFFSIGGQYAASIPIWLSDAATAPVVYLIARRYANEKISILASIAYGLSPFFLLYEGYLWYSSQPMTFLILLAFYFLTIRRPLFSSVVFALAVLFKQEVIIVLPIFLFWILRYSKPQLLKSVVIIIAIFVFVSLPFLVISPGGYVSSLSYGMVDSSQLPSSLSNPLTNSSISSLAASHSSSPTSLVCSTISNTWRSLVCKYGNFTYTDHKAVPSLALLVSAPFINTISPWITILMLAIASYYIYALRNYERTWMIASGIALMAFITLFSLDVHAMYRYYLVPVYGILLCCSEDRFSLILSASAPLLSILLPSGSIQLLPPVFAFVTLLTRSYLRDLGVADLEEVRSKHEVQVPVRT